MSFDFALLAQPDYHYRLIKCIRQHWFDRQFSYSRIARPDSGLMFVVKGCIRFECGCETFTAGKGDLVFLPKDCHYSACVDKEYGDTEDVLINFDAMPSCKLPDRPVKLLEGVGTAIVSLFDQILESSTQTHRSDLYTLGQFHILLDGILSEISAVSNKDKPYLKLARELIDSREELSLSQIAHLCGISESGLRSQFRASYGMSPQQYRMHTRMERAKYLLEATELSVYEISERLGFYDVAYFCKIFRKYNGCSPRKYAAGKSI